MPIPDLEHEAQRMLENWKLHAFANNVFLHRIPLERERDMLHTMRKKLWDSWRRLQVVRASASGVWTG